MIKQTLKNEKGSASLLIAFGIVGVSAFMILQMSTAFNAVNRSQKELKDNHYLTGTMQALGMMMKQAYNLGRSDGTCSMTVDGQSFAQRTIDGHVFCVPSDDGLCITNENITGTAEPVCISMQQASMDWTGGRSPSSVGDDPTWSDTADESSSSSSFNGDSSLGPNQSVRFQIPNKSNRQVWRTCTDSGVACARMALCPVGSTNCSYGSATAVQVVRLGDLSVSP